MTGAILHLVQKNVKVRKFLINLTVINLILVIVLGLKSEPYRRADAVRRSQRRKQENVRLSTSEMDL